MSSAVFPQLQTALVPPNVEPAYYYEMAARSLADGDVLWVVVGREKGAGYLILRWAARLARRFNARVTNPNGVHEFGSVRSRERARAACREYYRKSGGRWSFTYSPRVVGELHGFERVMADERRVDLFAVFDFSATPAVRAAPKYVLVETEKVRSLTARMKTLTEGDGET